MRPRSIMKLNNSLMRSLILSGGCLCLILGTLVSAIAKHVTTVLGFTLSALTTLPVMGALALAGFSFYEKNIEDLRRARLLLVISIPVIILGVFIFTSQTYVQGSDLLVLVFCVVSLLATYVPLISSIEAHIKHEGGELSPFSEKIRELSAKVRSWFVHARAGIVSFGEAPRFVVKVKRQADELLREVEFGSNLNELKEAIAIKFDRKTSEINKLIKNDSVAIESDEDVAGLTSDDFIEVCFFMN